MKPFVFRHADTVWPAGTTLLHVYVLVDPDRNAELVRLVDAAQQAVVGFPISAVPSHGLHLTIDQITDRPAVEIDQQQRDALVNELRRRIADVAPFTVQIGSLLSYHSGVIADVHPDDDMAALHATVHQAIRAVRGDAAVRYPYQPAHLTVGYAHAEADSDAVQRLLRRVRPSHAPLHIDAIHLVDVTATTADVRQITWEPVATIRLGTGDTMLTSTARFRSRQPLRLPAKVMHPVGVDEAATALELFSLASIAVIGVRLGMPVAAIRPGDHEQHQVGGVHFAEEYPNPDVRGILAWAPVIAGQEYLQSIGAHDPRNGAAVHDTYQQALTEAEPLVTASWDNLRSEAQRLVRAHWWRIARLAQKLADDAIRHGPIEPDPELT